jgi:hypothetical protein
VGGVLQFAQLAWSEVEGAPGETSEATITVVRTGGASDGVTVAYATSDDTATAGEDYTAASGTLSFAQGQTTATFTVTLTGDSVTEGNEALNLTLSNPTGRATLGTLSSAKLWIVEPEGAVKLVFVHHSTGENWLSDENGQLGLTLRNNNYFVSDTSYGWGPDAIGDRTDIGNWYDWFVGTSSTTYLAALYQEYGQSASYTRMDDPDPERENEVILFKSCFPNSALSGRPDDPATVGDNPLRGQGAGSEAMTVANAKGIYNDLLGYFATRPDKLFVLVTAPPLVAGATSPEQAANARALNDWLVNDWLAGYTQGNVAVFDFYNVLTSNGGSAASNDLDREGGNHDRVWNGAVQHVQAVASNVSAYASAADDSHPTAAGGRKASAEFVALLNLAVNRWRGLASAVGVPLSARAAASQRLAPDAVAPPGKGATR